MYRREQAKDDGESLVVVEDQGRHPVAADQSVAAVAAPLGFHGMPGSHRWWAVYRRTVRASVSR